MGRPAMYGQYKDPNDIYNKELLQIDGRFGETNNIQLRTQIEHVCLDKEDYLEKVLSFSSVLRNGRFRVPDYLKAVQYVTYRMAEMTIMESWSLTFPERMYRDGERKPEGTISALCYTYDKNAMVQKLLGQVQMPLHAMMMTERYKAAQKLFELMNDPDQTPRIQMESADKLLNHIKLPEAQSIEIDVNVNDGTLRDIGATLDSIAQLAKAKIEQGLVTATQVIEHRVGE